MDIVFNWAIPSMDEVKEAPDGLQDVVVNVYWRRTATCVIDEKIYTSSTYGCLAVSQPTTEGFIPYEDLTFEDVCGWLDAGLSVESLDQSLEINIQNQIDPPIISLPLPWLPQPPQPVI